MKTKVMKIFIIVLSTASIMACSANNKVDQIQDNSVLNNTPTPTPAIQTSKPTKKTTPTPKPTLSPEDILESKSFGEGQYYVGKDIPAGEYLAMALYDTGGYYCVSSDANGSDIIFNNNFDTGDILTVKEGEFVEVSRASITPIKEALAYFKNTENEISIFLEGFTYKVGTMLEPGTYKLEATSDSGGYYCVYKDSRQSKIIANDNFDGSSYVTVKKGQYLLLSRCKIMEE